MTDMLQPFYSSALKFLPILPLTETYKLTLDESKTLFEIDSGSIFLIKNNEFERVYSDVRDTEQTQPRKSGYSSKAFKTGIPIIMNRRQILASHPEMKDTNVQRFILVPLIYHEEALGMLSLRTTRQKEYSEDECKTLKLFGSIASLAISKSRLFDKDKKIVKKYDELFTNLSQESNPTNLTLDEFSQRIKDNLKKGNTPHFIWLEMLLWETYQNIQSIKNSL